MSSFELKETGSLRLLHNTTLVVKPTLHLSSLTPTSPQAAPRPQNNLSTAMDDDQKQQQEDWLNSRKNRLPSFTEVLSRRTRPPVDLFMF